jgi:hypothetical protein
MTIAIRCATSALSRNIFIVQFSIQNTQSFFVVFFPTYHERHLNISRKSINNTRIQHRARVKITTLVVVCTNYEKKLPHSNNSICFFLQKSRSPLPYSYSRPRPRHNTDYGRQATISNLEWFYR